jgi:energy-coupling factor transport system ATP-binding protein
MNEAVIKVENLGYTYSDSFDDEIVRVDTMPALEGVSLEIRRGEFVAVLGHNGSGKSTFAKLINLILTPTVGKIYIDGVDVTRDDFSDDELFDVRRKVGMVFQNPDNQLVATVVEEDVAFGPENLGLPREEIRKRVDDALKTVGMTEYIRHAPHKLSGGQKQRIAIAGIIAMKPEVIIFDESTAMLDPQGRAEVIKIMEKLNREEGITVINITHYMDEAARADRVVVINDGRLIMDDAARAVFKNTALLHSVGLEATQGAELLGALAEVGLNISGDALTLDETVETIANYLKELK